MHAAPGMHIINDCPGFVFRFIACSAIVSRPVNLELLVGDDLLVSAVKEVNLLVALKLKNP